MAELSARVGRPPMQHRVVKLDVDQNTTQDMLQTQLDTIPGVEAWEIAGVADRNGLWLFLQQERHN